VAQSLTAIRQRALRKPGGLDKDDTFAIQLHELDEKKSWPPGEIIPDSKRLPPPFDFERLTRFMGYGFLMAPIQHKWFSFLSRTFPITKSAGMVPALKRVAFDQFLFAPIGRSLCFDVGRPFILTRTRSRCFLHIHDRCRGRWQACYCEEVPRCLHTRSQGKLHGLAIGADHQLPSDANSVPNRK
jgi:hypothetical protein